jgi:dCMP deaminase
MQRSIFIQQTFSVSRILNKRCFTFKDVSHFLNVKHLYENTTFANYFNFMEKYQDPDCTPNKEKQLLLDKRYLAMAGIWAQNSYCKRRQVGALIVKNKMIISDGFNGTPSGFENICEDESGVTKPYVLHAEANAITKVAKSNNSSDGATLYITSSPCIECAKLIIQSGIKRVVYEDNYHKTDGVELLARANIDTICVKD